VTHRKARVPGEPVAQHPLVDRVTELVLIKLRVYRPDIARMVLWLAADDSRLCTAQNLIVDAGWA
jgi:NAD(P)-dependent dehydrogenase (short-subunit alcohol dehydrogenase family)